MSASFKNKSECCSLEESNSGGNSSSKVRVSAIISVVLFFVCVGLAAALIFIILKKDEDSEPVNGGDSEYCLTAHCAMMAGAMAGRMNMEVDPCDDFVEFSCGRWKKRTVIPEDKPMFWTVLELMDDLNAMLKDLIEQQINDDDLDPVKNVKKNYLACIDLDTIEERGSQPLIDLMVNLGGWPVLGNNSGGNWDESAFDLEDQLALLRGEYGKSVIYDASVGIDDDDSTKYILKLYQPGLALPSSYYYLEDGGDNTYLQAYLEYMTTIATMLGADADVAAEDFNDLIEFEIKLANLTKAADQRRDNSSALNNKMTIAELQYNVTGFNWLDFFRQLGASWSKDLQDSEEIVVNEPRCVREITEVVQNTSQRTIANYIVWIITMGKISKLSSNFRDIKQKYDEVVYGTTSQNTRWQRCVHDLTSVMDFAVGRIFVDVHYDEESKIRTNKMIDFIQEAFFELVDESEWMDAPTKVVTKEKAEVMNRHIGYPEWIKDDDELTDYYKNYDFDSGNYFENYLQYRKEDTQRRFEYLRKTVDNSRWFDGLAVVTINAIYEPHGNSILFPAGILQPLFYHKDSPEYLNFGGIGHVIGHEITHGFDERWRQYDKDGILRQWWTNESIEAYTEREQCIVDQYDKYYMEECNMTLNGVKTKAENVADNGGLKEAYRGYRKMVEETMDGEELRLPGIDLTQDQMLFVKFAQIWCSKYTEQGARNKILTGRHSPERYRVEGTISNLPEFAKVFNCPADSPMNPDEKCTVW
ncbi:membrane metallo-endopeptidase-like 1 [Ptychodera flava]|uniref:membrane metallo-endopeptidase-like 1 n=1 Tax=Ptychodera flava TaxID=63121 RepID=UPI00396A84EB